MINSRGIAPVLRIDDVHFPHPVPSLREVLNLYAAAPMGADLKASGLPLHPAAS